MDNKVVCVVGPTACGKTKMGVALAQRFGGEVVSVDSMQIYRGMTVGTAAPTAEEMEGVPHHMVAVADPAESWSVARYVREADACVQDILRRGKRPVPEQRHLRAASRRPRDVRPAAPPDRWSCRP